MLNAPTFNLKVPTHCKMIIAYLGRNVKDYRKNFLRYLEKTKFFCPVCGKTHAILPDFIRPYKHYPAADIEFVDVEGMTIYYGKGSKGYLICSSQGDSTFQVYDRISNKYLSSFTNSGTDTIDVTTETDGCDVTNVNLGAPYSEGGFNQYLGGDYSEGLFIAHDHVNDCTDRTNLKLIPWKRIKEIID